MRHLALAAVLLSVLTSCGDDETSASSGAAASGTGASGAAGTATGAGGHAGGAGGGSTSSNSGGASSTTGAGGDASGVGGGVAGCAGRACGSACFGEAGSGYCTAEEACVLSPVMCPGYAPCFESSCGDPCSSCSGADPDCIPVPGGVCDITGSCSYPPPACD